LPSSRAARLRDQREGSTMSGASPDFAYVVYVAATPEELSAALTGGKLSKEY